MRPSRPALLSSIMSIALLWPMMAAAQDRPAQDHPALVAGRPAPAVQGVWRSRGYGYVARITADGAKLFHVAGDFCYADPRPERETNSLFSFYRPWGTDGIAFSRTPEQTRFLFDRLPSLPPACNDPAPWSRPRIAALVAATFADLYPSFAERGIDWPAQAAAALRALNGNSNDAILFDTLRTMLAGIEDPHVELHAKVAGKARDFEPGDGVTLGRIRGTGGNGGDPRTRQQQWERVYRSGVLDTVLQGKGHRAANDKLLWGRAGDVGYLNLLSMGGFGATRGDTTALDAALDDAIAAFDGARAVIVDISNNDGGGDRIAQHIAGRFADARRLAYTKIGFGAQGVEPQPFHVEPSKRARYLGPVYLLTSDITLSAAEVFALYMRALPNVTHVGDTTRGAFSDMITKPLPNGWTLLMSAEIYRDPAGENYEVRGLPPQVKREVFPPDDLTGGHARAVRGLMDEIRRDPQGIGRGR